MSSMILVLATAVVCAPVSAGFSLNNIHVKPTVAQMMQGQWLIAQKYGGADPHGDDPHGGDPHDENHDDKLPANKDRGIGKAPKDVYGGTIPNDQQPY
jgi:hypothetical protein